MRKQTDSFDRFRSLQRIFIFHLIFTEITMPLTNHPIYNKHKKPHYPGRPENAVPTKPISIDQVTMGNKNAGPGIMRGFGLLPVPKPKLKFKPNNKG